MRKLASLQEVNDIKKIPDADKICAYGILGWYVVDQIGKYKIGDKVIYLEIDSWVPDIIAPFLTKEGYYPKVFNNVPGQRLKTIKLRGQFSQGLILPPSIDKTIEKYAIVDDDLTDFLGVQKYEIISEGNELNQKGLFPRFIPKTDEERIQNLTKRYDSFKSLEFEITEKLDGSSLTVYSNNNEFGICSRNFELKPDADNWYTNEIRKFEDLQSKFTSLNRNLAIQGEIIGKGIQGNKYKFNSSKLFVFNIFDIDKQTYLDRKERVELCCYFGMNHVPTVYTDFGIHTDMPGLIKSADGYSELNQKTRREGLMFKCISDKNVHFKITSQEFLMKLKGNCNET